jgi:hypothetical protein
MAVVMMDGFDVYNGIGANTGMNSGRWTLDSGQFPNSMVAGRFGGQAVNFIHGSFVSVISRPFPAATANLTFGFALRCSSFPGGTPTQKGHFLRQIWRNVPMRNIRSILVAQSASIECLLILPVHC